VRFMEGRRQRIALDASVAEISDDALAWAATKPYDRCRQAGMPWWYAHEVKNDCSAIGFCSILWHAERPAEGRQLVVRARMLREVVPARRGSAGRE
jgi:hypothetical protein